MSGSLGRAAAKRVLQDVLLVDQVADLSHATLPQIVEKSTSCSNMDRGDKPTIKFVDTVSVNPETGQLATTVGP